MTFIVQIPGDHGGASTAGDHRDTVVTDQAQTGSFSSRLGEHRCERLPDGVVACLNTKTTLRYRYDLYRRHIEISSGGEATFFNVRQGLSRPLDVNGGGLTAVALTGSFDFHRKLDSDQVTVIDGEVEVLPTAAFRAAARLARVVAPIYHALQQVEFDLSTNTWHMRRSLTKSDLTQLMSWQRGRIDLNGLTLRQALDEFGRYQSINVFKLQSESLATLRMAGDLEATDLKGFLTSLERVYNIHHSMTTRADGTTVVILSRRREKMGNQKEKRPVRSKAVAGVDWRES